MKKNRKGAALLASGLMLAGVSMAGVFAAVIDTASSGALEITSAEIPQTDIDLKIDPTARSQGSTVNCQTVLDAATPTMVDDATTPYITITDGVPGSTVIKDFCIGNEGTDPAVMSVDLIEATDIEVGGCSVTETAGGDATCGDGLAGELAEHVSVSLKVHGPQSGTAFGGDTCDGSFNAPTLLTTDATATATPLTLQGFGNTPTPTVFAAGDAACVQVALTYDASTPAAAALLAQTDKVSVRLRFNGAE